MNAETFQSHLATIDAGLVARHAIFKRAAAVWQLAQTLLKEYQPRFEEAGLNDDQIDSLYENTIFAYAGRRPASASLDGASEKLTLNLQEPYGERWTDGVLIPYPWLIMTDAELTTIFRSMLDGWLKDSKDRQAAKDDEQARQDRETYAVLKARFEP